MTLRDQMADDVPGVFLNTDDFAETIRYLPKGGGSRPVIAIVDEDDQFDGRTSTERIMVFCSSDPNQAEISAGGKSKIDSPQIGDSLVRESDDVTRKYSWTGEKTDVDPLSGCWTLTFHRPVMHRQAVT